MKRLRYNQSNIRGRCDSNCGKLPEIPRQDGGCPGRNSDRLSPEWKSRTSPLNRTAGVLDC
jgi:hypothetical protein